MTALAKDRNTMIKSRGRSIDLLVAASTKIYAGSMVAINATGYAVPAANTAALRVIGRAEAQADNTSGADGALHVRVNVGVHKYGNGATTQALAQADIGQPCYVIDDQTVGKYATKGVKAGTVDEIDADGGIWVDCPADFDDTKNVGTEIVSAAGAVAVGVETTFLSVTGTVAYTLADGRYDGQKKNIRCVVAASTPIGTVTPATALAVGSGGAASWIFKGVGDFAMLEWKTASGWAVLASVLTP